MDNRLTDLSHPAVAAQSRNKTAIAGTCTMNTVLAAAYIAEVLKGVRSLPSYLIFLLLCLLPCVTSILAYTKQKDTSSVRYLCGGGFALLYAYVMFTSSTDLTFCYVIVMLLILLVYADKKLVSLLCTYALVINILVLVFRAVTQGFTAAQITNAEIIIACIILSYIFVLMSVTKIAQINDANIKKADSDRTQSDDLLKLTLKVAGDMAGNIDQVSHSTSQLRDSIAGTQTAMEDLTSGTSETAAAIQVQQQQTENIDQQVQNVSSVTAELLSSTAETSANLTASKDVMKNLVQQVQVSEASSTRVADSMEELKEYADKMQSIVALISSVASQTSLLALNASIEAARAGEAGRGFAVVAEEIRKLSSETSASSGQIQNALVRLEETSAKMMTSMEKTLELIQQTMEKVTQTGENVKKINEDSSQLGDHIQDIDSAMREVETSNSQLVENMEQVSDIMSHMTNCINDSDETSKRMLSKYEESANNINSIESVIESLMCELGFGGFMGIEDVEAGMKVLFTLE